MFQLSQSKLWAVASGSSHLTYQGEMILVFVESTQEGTMEDKKYMFCDCLNGGLSIVLFSSSYIFVNIHMHVFKTAVVQML
jgi:hypothetical protein